MDKSETKRQVSKGICYFCKKEIAKSGMSKHLAACEARKTAQQPSQKDKSPMGKLLHLQIEGSYLPIYWLHIEIPAEATLQVLDQFLRDIWLECCGHLSKFEIEHQTYSVYPMAEFREKNMKHPLSKMLKSDMKFAHQYDYGTSTDLTLKVIGERDGAVNKKSPIQILARNTQPDILCAACGKKPATEVCPMCLYEGTGFLCDKCSKKHECGEDMLLPVVNSPRMGECGYTGPDSAYSF